MTHIIRVTYAYTDGFTSTHEGEQPGKAAEAHAALAARWKAAGYTFSRDRFEGGYSLSRDRTEPHPHTETVEHMESP